MRLELNFQLKQLQTLGVRAHRHWAVAGPAWITLALVWGYWMYEG